jgi:hypothetical protein
MPLSKSRMSWPPQSECLCLWLSLKCSLNSESLWSIKNSSMPSCLNCRKCFDASFLIPSDVYAKDVCLCVSSRIFTPSTFDDWALMYVACQSFVEANRVFKTQSWRSECCFAFWVYETSSANARCWVSYFSSWYSYTWICCLYSSYVSRSNWAESIGDSNFGWTGSTRWVDEVMNKTHVSQDNAIVMPVNVPVYLNFCGFCGFCGFWMVWISECLNFWMSEFLNVWISECLMSEYLNASIPQYLNEWSRKMKVISSS